MKESYYHLGAFLEDLGVARVTDSSGGGTSYHGEAVEFVNGKRVILLYRDMRDILALVEPTGEEMALLKAGGIQELRGLDRCIEVHEC